MTTFDLSKVKFGNDPKFQSSFVCEFMERLNKVANALYEFYELDKFEYCAPLFMPFYSPWETNAIDLSGVAASPYKQLRGPIGAIAALQEFEDGDVIEVEDNNCLSGAIINKTKNIIVTFEFQFQSDFRISLEKHENDVHKLHEKLDALFDAFDLSTAIDVDALKTLFTNIFTDLVTGRKLDEEGFAEFTSLAKTISNNKVELILNPEGHTNYPSIWVTKPLNMDFNPLQINATTPHAKNMRLFGVMFHIVPEEFAATEEIANTCSMVVHVDENAGIRGQSILIDYLGYDTLELFNAELYDYGKVYNAIGDESVMEESVE